MDPTTQGRAAAEPFDGAATKPESPQTADAQAAPVASSAAPESCESAWRHVGCHALLWLTAAIGLTVDLTSKHFAFEHLAPDREVELIPHVLSLQTSLNRGALFGIGKGLAPVFVIASVLAVGFVLYMFRSSTRRQWWTHLALGLVLAGALGNLYDRLFVKLDVVRVFGQREYYGRILPTEHDFVQIGQYPDGREPIYRMARHRVELDRVPAVRDFIAFKLTIRDRNVWPWIFNVADAMLVVGVGVLLIIHWRSPGRAPAAASAQPPPTGES